MEYLIICWKVLKKLRRSQFRHSIKTINDKILAIVTLWLNKAAAIGSANKNSNEDAITLANKTIKAIE